MIYVRTRAYNAAKTLRRAVDSILNQTYTDFSYYLCENGSTDNGESRRIVEEYAKRDARIVPFYNEKNNVLSVGNERFMDLEKHIDDNDYYCTLDADDEYMLDFMEKAMAFMEKNNLEIVCCGSDFIDGDTGKLIKQRMLPENMLLTDGEAFASDFPTCYQFGSTIWAKLFKASVIKNMGLKSIKAKKLSSGGDTVFSLTAFQATSRIGILSGTLHRYYIFPKSSHRTVYRNRFKANVYVFETARNLIIAKCGSVSPRNEQFLYAIYFIAIKDTLSIMPGAQLTVAEKIQHLKDIFTYETTRELFRNSYMANEELDEVRIPILNWLLAQKECREPEGAITTAEIMTAMYADLTQLLSQEALSFIVMKMPEMVDYLLKKDYKWVLERLNKWNNNHDAVAPLLTELEIAVYRALNKSDDEIFNLLMDIRKKRPQSSKKLDIDTQVTELIGKYPLLKNVSAKLASAFPRAVCSVMKENFPQALDQFLSATQGMEIADDDAEAYVLLGQKLSAVAENAGAYVYFKKVWVSYLLDCSRNDEAIRELDECDQLVPDDKDFAALRERLNS